MNDALKTPPTEKAASFNPHSDDEKRLKKCFGKWMESPTSPRTLQALAELMVDFEIAAHIRKQMMRKKLNALPFTKEEA
jgi:hypothetical protein